MLGAARDAVPAGGWRFPISRPPAGDSPESTRPRASPGIAAAMLSDKLFGPSEWPGGTDPENHVRGTKAAAKCIEALRGST
jgi:hypothetical protein